MDDNNIYKLLFDEIKEKKKIGRNIFYRVATRKGGKIKALRTPYFYMSNKEKKKLNGEVITMNMNELIPKEDFFKFDESTQKEILTNWIKKYSVQEILKGMKISISMYYSLLKKLNIGIYKDSTNQSEFEVNDENFKKIKEKLKQELPYTYEEFVSLSKEMKSQLVANIFNKYSSKLLAQHLNTSVKNISNIKYRFKENNKKKNNDKNNIINNQKQEVSNDKKQEISPVVLENKNQDVQVINAEMMDDFFFTLNKKEKSHNIIKKLKMLISLLEDEEDKDFYINLTVRG